MIDDIEDTDELDPPKAGHYRVWWPEMDGREEWAEELKARDAVEAAEEWARKDDRESVEFKIVGGTTARLHVRDSANALHVFDVEGRSEPVYKARRVQP